MCLLIIFFMTQASTYIVIIFVPPISMIILEIIKLDMRIITNIIINRILSIIILFLTLFFKETLLISKLLTISSGVPK